jgi:hypothetical protein
MFKRELFFLKIDYVSRKGISPTWSEFLGNDFDPLEELLGKRGIQVGKVGQK